MTPLRQKNSVTEPLVARPFCFADNPERSGDCSTVGRKAMAEPVPFKYRAFISYSHADTSWAKWLHRALESFTIDKDLVGRETTTGTVPKRCAHLPRPRRLHRGPYALRADARRARCLGRAHRHLLARCRQEPLRQRGDQALQVAASRSAGHSADRRRQARRCRARMLPPCAQVQARCRRQDHRRAGRAARCRRARGGRRQVPRARQGRRRPARRLLRRHLPPRRARPPPQGTRAQRHHRRARHPRRRGDGQRRLCLAAAQDQRGFPHRHASRRDRDRQHGGRAGRDIRRSAHRPRSRCSPRPKACSTTWRVSAARRPSCATRRPGC